MPTHPLIGKELGNYTIKSLIGEGGMGVVFAGEHRFLGTKCAIKVLHGSYANNPQVTQRFFQWRDQPNALPRSAHWIARG